MELKAKTSYISVKMETNRSKTVLLFCCKYSIMNLTKGFRTKMVSN